ncbi:MAG: ribosome biogenesis GTPase YlqF [Anaerorhabdus sp.]
MAKDMYQKRKERKEKKLGAENTDEKSFASSRINWYPGHMTKAKRLMEESMKAVDMVIEIRDARIPQASKNPMIDQLIQQKPRLILLSKKDKASPLETQKWQEYFKSEGIAALPIDFLTENVTSIIVKACQELMKEKIEKQKSRGIRPRAIRAMVVGVPNVGKSTMINRVVKRKIAASANRPGVTKALQWIRLNNEVELLDTPGILWPKFEDQEVGYYLALTGAIRDEVVPLEEVAAFGMKKLMENDPQILKKHYGIELVGDEYQMLENLGKKKNLIQSGGEVSYEKTVLFFLTELRNDKCGMITWEKVNDKDDK